MEKFIKYLSFLLVFLLIISLTQFNFNYIYSTNQQTDSLKKQIEICCTCGNKLEDGILTYEINNAKPETKELVTYAISYWKENIPEIEFKETDGKEQVDIKISFRNDNGKVAGQTMTNFDSDGFIFDVKILLAEEAFGKQLNKNVIGYIAKHEFGHALGLGHANVNGFLMSSLVYNSFNEISDCEREAVNEANKWKLIDNDSSPKISKIKKYFC